jgi:glycosyltransferase involved in cell wall biosynthesis
VPIKSAAEITDGLADAIIQIARNPGLRISMGQRASEFVARTYREETYINGIEAIYEEVRRKPLKAG